MFDIFDSVLIPSPVSADNDDAMAVSVEPSCNLETHANISTSNDDVPL
jgi:hypothetical protein